jgi:hypothetical protein
MTDKQHRKPDLTRLHLGQLLPVTLAENALQSPEGQRGDYLLSPRLISASDSDWSQSLLCP